MIVRLYNCHHFFLNIASAYIDDALPLVMWKIKHLCQRDQRFMLYLLIYFMNLIPKLRNYLPLTLNHKIWEEKIIKYFWSKQLDNSQFVFESQEKNLLRLQIGSPTTYFNLVKILSLHILDTIPVMKSNLHLPDFWYNIQKSCCLFNVTWTPICIVFPGRSS